MKFVLLKRFKTVYLFCILFVLAILAALGITQLQQQGSDFVSNAEVSDVAMAAEPIQPIPLKVELDEEKVELGNQLFHDPRLSSNDTISCATCHLLDKGGTDRRVTSEGMMGRNTGLNSPTVFNSGFHFRLNWDGEAATLEDQIDGPISTAKEMGGLTWPDLIYKLEQSTEYTTTFKQIYPDGMTRDTIKDALATFQRSLYTPNAPFDQYLRGQDNAISAAAKQGYNRFKSYGCVTCHQGMLVGGNMYQKLGVFGDYFADRGTLIESDLGRYNVTKDDRDRHFFKVPSLRNVTLTAPYFHDGNAATLNEAIKLMGKYQLGVDIPQKDVDSIIIFLRTLTGEYQGNPL